MSRESLVIIIGISILALWYSGIPASWKELAIPASGMLLIILGYSLRRSAFFRSIEVIPGERRSDAFVEHTNVTASEVER
jgi:hypothetical protein